MFVQVLLHALFLNTASNITSIPRPSISSETATFNCEGFAMVCVLVALAFAVGGWWCSLCNFVHWVSPAVLNFKNEASHLFNLFEPAVCVHNVHVPWDRGKICRCLTLNFCYQPALLKYKVMVSERKKRVEHGTSFFLNSIHIISRQSKIQR